MWDWDSTVCTATSYRLEGPGIECWWEREFPHSSRPALVTTQPPIQWVSFQGLKRPGRGVNHPHASSVEVKERVELYLYSLSEPSWQFSSKNSSIDKYIDTVHKSVQQNCKYQCWQRIRVCLKYHAPYVKNFSHRFTTTSKLPQAIKPLFWKNLVQFRAGPNIPTKISRGVFLNPSRISSFYLTSLGEEGYSFMWSHTVTLSQSGGLLWMRDRAVAETSTWKKRHSQQTNIHAHGGIRTRDPSRRAAAHPQTAQAMGSAFQEHSKIIPQIRPRPLPPTLFRSHH